jgi:hypothetical protein
MIINGEKLGMWKEEVVACFRVLFRHFHGEIEENHERLSQENRVPTEHKTRILPLHQSARCV